jgi:hypothetical protein
MVNATLALPGISDLEQATWWLDGWYSQSELVLGKDTLIGRVSVISTVVAEIEPKLNTEIV